MKILIFIFACLATLFAQAAESVSVSLSATSITTSQQLTPYLEVVGVQTGYPRPVIKSKREPIVSHESGMWVINFPDHEPATRAYTRQEADALRVVIRLRLERGSSWQPSSKLTIEQRTKLNQEAAREREHSDMPQNIKWVIWWDRICGFFIAQDSEVNERVLDAMTAGLTAEDIRNEDRRKYDKKSVP